MNALDIAKIFVDATGGSSLIAVGIQGARLLGAHISDNEAARITDAAQRGIARARDLLGESASRDQVLREAEAYFRDLMPGLVAKYEPKVAGWLAKRLQAEMAQVPTLDHVLLSPEAEPYIAAVKDMGDRILGALAEAKAAPVADAAPTPAPEATLTDVVTAIKDMHGSVVAALAAPQPPAIAVPQPSAQPQTGQPGAAAPVPGIAA